MDDGRKAPSAWTVIKEDSFALVCVVICITVLLFVPMTIVGIPPEAYLGLAVLPVGILFLAWRVLTIRRIFLHGPEVEATIAKISYLPPYGPPLWELELKYMYEGREYKIRQEVFGRRMVPWREKVPYKLSDKTVLVVDPRKPERTFLKDRFL